MRFIAKPEFAAVANLSLDLSLKFDALNFSDFLRKQISHAKIFANFNKNANLTTNSLSFSKKMMQMHTLVC